MYSLASRNGTIKFVVSKHVTSAVVKNSDCKAKHEEAFTKRFNPSSKATANLMFHLANPSIGNNLS